MYKVFFLSIPENFCSGKRFKKKVVFHIPHIMLVGWLVVSFRLFGKKPLKKFTNIYRLGRCMRVMYIISERMNFLQEEVACF